MGSGTGRARQLEIGRNHPMLECVDHRISIRNLRISTVIGAYEQERIIEQEIVCNLDIKLSPAISKTDDLCDTVNYATVAECLSTWVGLQTCHLIEHLAYGAVQKVFEIDQRICSVRLEIFKPGCIAKADGAAIELSYLRNE